jgi:hypothetical protein
MKVSGPRTDEVILNSPNPPSRSIDPRGPPSLQQKWAQEDISEGKARQTRKADNPTAIYEKIV